MAPVDLVRNPLDTAVNLLHGVRNVCDPNQVTQLAKAVQVLTDYEHRSR
jgi:hypothetical protein